MHFGATGIIELPKSTVSTEISSALSTSRSSRHFLGTISYCCPLCWVAKVVLFMSFPPFLHRSITRTWENHARFQMINIQLLICWSWTVISSQQILSSFLTKIFVKDKKRCHNQLYPFALQILRLFHTYNMLMTLDHSFESFARFPYGFRDVFCYLITIKPLFTAPRFNTPKTNDELSYSNQLFVSYQ
jgi:hypothetical protein